MWDVEAAEQKAWQAGYDLGVRAAKAAWEKDNYPHLRVIANRMSVHARTRPLQGYQLVQISRDLMLLNDKFGVSLRPNELPEDPDLVQTFVAGFVAGTLVAPEGEEEEE